MNKANISLLKATTCFPYLWLNTPFLSHSYILKRYNRINLSSHKCSPDTQKVQFLQESIFFIGKMHNISIKDVYLHRNTV